MRLRLRPFSTVCIAILILERVSPAADGQPETMEQEVRRVKVC